jgi:hypothetical protein
MEQTISIAGAVMILAAYGANQLGWLAPARPLYNVLNLVGSVILAAIAWRSAQWGFLLLEGAWALLTIPPLIRSVRS